MADELALIVGIDLLISDMSFNVSLTLMSARCAGRNTPQNHPQKRPAGDDDAAHRKESRRKRMVQVI